MGQPNDNHVSHKTLTELLELLASATVDDFDELLTDLLSQAYRTVAAQNC